MNLSFSVPNPLARLTGLLVALEQARAEAAVQGKDQGKVLDQVNKPTAEVTTDREGDLESLSLSRCGESLEPRSHDLEAMSLSRVEEAPAGRDGGLRDASLERKNPRRTRR
jgi:hypothetical protein